ncbi:hypothetical protein BDC45DRAFT_542181 [Circinella umbellata]|nr:hypothetical protein BDC45DRAFT_542181 [Circinella umbellata]
MAVGAVPLQLKTRKKKNRTDMNEANYINMDRILPDHYSADQEFVTYNDNSIVPYFFGLPGYIVIASGDRLNKLVWSFVSSIICCYVLRRKNINALVTFFIAIFFCYIQLTSSLTLLFSRRYLHE